MNLYGQEKLKLVLTGDNAVGKSSLIINYLKNTFSYDYEPTVLDVFEGPKMVKGAGKKIELEIHDTSGDENLIGNRRI